MINDDRRCVRAGINSSDSSFIIHHSSLYHYLRVKLVYSACNSAKRSALALRPSAIISSYRERTRLCKSPPLWGVVSRITAAPRTSPITKPIKKRIKVSTSRNIQENYTTLSLLRESYPVGKSSLIV